MTRFVVDRDTLLEIAAGEIEVAPGHQLLAPAIVRSQALSALYRAARRGEISADEALERITRINSLKVRFLGDKVLQRTAFRMADKLGWDSTEDAEFVALTQLHADAFVTSNEDLARAVSGIVKTASIDALGGGLGEDPPLSTLKLSRVGSLPQARGHAASSPVGRTSRRRSHDMATTDHAVVIAGGGPTGLMLAAELALANVDVVIVERRATQELGGARSGGLHARTIEVFDQRGIADRFLSEGQVAQVAGFAGVRLDIGDFPTRHHYGLGLRQNHIERILTGWVDELGVRILRGHEVTGFVQDDTGVEVEVSGGRPLRADYLVGCDGGRSRVRKAAGIEFPGTDPTTSNLIAEVEMTEEPDWGIRHDDLGIHSISRLEYEIRDGEVIYMDHGPIGVLVTERHVGSGEPTLRDLTEALIAVYGTDYGIHSPTWLSRFTDAARQATAYRRGRVLLAGDAAHVHPPDGGQGLQTGVQDAVNLGWKLAQVVAHTSAESLLDTYHSERHPVASRVLRNTIVQVVLRPQNERTQALRDTFAELLAMEEPRRRFAAMMSGLDIHYDLGEGHPLLGRRMPDLDLVTADGPVRVYTLLHEARPVLLNLGSPGDLDATPWADRVRMIDATYAGPWELPALGEVSSPTAVLIRPDGYVAWVGEDGTQQRLVDALTTWFGQPAGRVARRS